VCALDVFFLFFNASLLLSGSLALLPGSKAVKKKKKKNRGKPPEYQLTAAADVKSRAMQVQTFAP